MASGQLGSAQGISQPAPVSAVYEQVHQLDQALQALQMEVIDTEQKLGPVLRSIPPEPGNKPIQAVESLCPLAERLRDLTALTRGITNQVVLARQRLEI